MIAVILDHALEALGFAVAARVWRLGWPRVQTWLRDFALVDVEAEQ